VKAAKLAIAVVLFAIAAVLAVRNLRGGHGVPDTPESRTQWMCSACLHPFQMTAREAEEAARRGPPPWPPAFCPQCRAKKAYVAMRCPNCGTFFFGPEVEGYTGECPKCRPPPPPPPPPPEEDGSTVPEQPRPKVS